MDDRGRRGDAIAGAGRNSGRGRGVFGTAACVKKWGVILRGLWQFRSAGIRLKAGRIFWGDKRAFS